MVLDILGRTRVSHSGVVRKKILLVDDDTDMLSLSKRLLQAEGYEVADLSDGCVTARSGLCATSDTVAKSRIGS